MEPASAARNDDGFLPTRGSLLSRLKNVSDAAGWQYFANNYGRLIFQSCLRAGPEPAAVAKQMPRFDKRLKKELK